MCFSGPKYAQTDPLVTESLWTYKVQEASSPKQQHPIRRLTLYTEREPKINFGSHRNSNCKYQHLPS